MLWVKLNSAARPKAGRTEQRRNKLSAGTIMATATQRTRLWQVAGFWGITFRYSDDSNGRMADKTSILLQPPHLNAAVAEFFGACVFH